MLSKALGFSEWKFSDIWSGLSKKRKSQKGSSSLNNFLFFFDTTEILCGSQTSKIAVNNGHVLYCFCLHHYLRNIFKENIHFCMNLQYHSFLFNIYQNKLIAVLIRIIVMCLYVCNLCTSQRIRTLCWPPCHYLNKQ